MKVKVKIRSLNDPIRLIGRYFTYSEYSGPPETTWKYVKMSDNNKLIEYVFIDNNWESKSEYPLYSTAEEEVHKIKSGRYKEIYKP